jgi:hypothetical protein
MQERALRAPLGSLGPRFGKEQNIPIQILIEFGDPDQESRERLRIRSHDGVEVNDSVLVYRGECIPTALFTCSVRLASAEAEAQSGPD